MSIKTICVECGPNIIVDEDGCCVSCGRDSVGAGVEIVSNQIAALRARLAPPVNEGQTHYEGCWKDRGHHACALERLAEAEKRWMEMAINCLRERFERRHILVWSHWCRVCGHALDPRHKYNYDDWCAEARMELGR